MISLKNIAIKRKSVILTRGRAAHTFGVGCFQIKFQKPISIQGGYLFMASSVFSLQIKIWNLHFMTTSLIIKVENVIRFSLNLTM